MEMRLTSADDLHAAIERSFDPDVDVAHIKPGLCITFIWNSDQYISKVTEFYAELKNKADFMRRGSKAFSWPTGKIAVEFLYLTVWEKKKHSLGKATVPEVTT